LLSALTNCEPRTPLARGPGDSSSRSPRRRRV